MIEVQENAGLLRSSGGPVADIMFDQLEFLVDHFAHCTSSHCDECSRFILVRQTLMRPFVETEFRVGIRERLWDQLGWPESAEHPLGLETGGERMQR